MAKKSVRNDNAELDTAANINFCSDITSAQVDEIERVATECDGPSRRMALILLHRDGHTLLRAPPSKDRAETFLHMAHELSAYHKRLGALITMVQGAEARALVCAKTIAEQLECATTRT